MQNTFSQSGNDSKWFLIKIIFQNRYVALGPPPFMANAILNFHFDYWHTSLMVNTVTRMMKTHILSTISPDDDSEHLDCQPRGHAWTLHGLLSGQPHRDRVLCFLCHEFSHKEMIQKIALIICYRIFAMFASIVICQA